jgi:hypothetical protein
VIRKAQRDAAHHANLLGLTPAGRGDLEVEPIVVDPAEACFDKWVTRHNRKNADAHLLHRRMIDALAELAASLIRNGGDPQAIQRWVDGELDRIEAIASQGAHRQDH